MASPPAPFEMSVFPPKPDSVGLHRLVAALFLPVFAS